MNDIVSTPPAVPPAQEVDAGPWWPTVDVGTTRSLMRIGGTSISQDRLVDAIRFGVIDVTRQLTAWRVGMEAEGFASLAEVAPAEQVDGKSEREWLFLRAVAMTAGAELADRYPDLTATREGADRAQVQMDSADDFRRSATRAIRLLKGEPGISVELI